ncbi:MAG: hypothetical protein RM347_035690 [Nostoc sp. ChiQUE02]|uniref:hypothetical protein n=1 Tax=Nostoc sp. ChiQUE02 TaxID=3075377 RepID=UPI002AD580F4|nr:hypothetical protein [Nostoc sp. ChiQUE02]MDZ8232736.1 hypothetical protein [Nostoc sp. ChiQUE02]
MNPQENSELLAALMRQEELLKQLVAAINKPKLGLHSEAGSCKMEVNALAASTFDGEEIKQVIRQELAEAIAQIKGLIEKGSDEVALPTQEAASVEQQVIPDYSAIRENILSQLKTGKQSAAKAIDAFIESLGAVKEQQRPTDEELGVAS